MKYDGCTIYVLVMLFVKYISDKYVGVPYAPIVEIYREIMS